MKISFKLLLLPTAMARLANHPNADAERALQEEDTRA